MLSYSPLRIKGHVAGSTRVGPEDTLSTKKALHDLGYYDIPDYGMTPYPDQPMFDGIAQVQKNNDLFHDRAMRPGGETEAAINRELGQRDARSGVKPAIWWPAPGQDRPKPTPAGINPGTGDERARKITNLKRELREALIRLNELENLINSTSDPEERESLQDEYEELDMRADEIVEELVELGAAPWE
jgi:hypothetical protein